MSNTECEQCKYRDDCVNVDKFNDGDCLAFVSMDEKEDLK